MYISYVLLALVAVKCVSESLKEKSYNRSKSIVCFESLNIALCGLSVLVLVGSFVFESHRVEYGSIKNISRDETLHGYEWRVDGTKRTLETYVDVGRFEYDVENWCVETDYEADINIKMGILNLDTQEIKLYKTCLKPQWAAMEDFPDNRIRVVAHLWRGVELMPNESYVVLATDHEGNIVYNTF